MNTGAHIEKFLGYAASGDAGRADNQRYDFHICLPEKGCPRRTSNNPDLASAHVHHDLHFLAARIEQRAESLLDNRFGLYASRHNLFDRQFAT
jgi:hypothetical protein